MGARVQVKQHGAMRSHFGNVATFCVLLGVTGCQHQLRRVGLTAPKLGDVFGSWWPWILLAVLAVLLGGARARRK